MKKYVLLALAAIGVPFAAYSLTADQVYMLNSKMGATANYLQLGTLLDNGTFLDLASGKMLVGNSSGVATERTLSGDVTVSNTGVSAIGANKVLESMIVAAGTTGLGVRHVARAVYDFAVNGGAISTISLGVALPAKALITKSFIYVDTQFVDAGAGTHAYQCEDANNIKTATDLTGSAAGAFIDGASTGSAATMVGSIASSCNISIVIAGAALTAGKQTVYVEYVVSD